MIKMCLNDSLHHTYIYVDQPYTQSWESYFIKVIYYILLVTFANSNVMKLHIT